MDRGQAHGRDAVHQQQGGALTGDGGDFAHGMEHARGGFGVLYQHADNSRVCGQSVGHVLRFHSLAPGHADRDHLQPARDGDFTPALAELASFHHQHLFAGGKQVVHGGGHGARAGRGQGQHCPRSAEKGPQAFLHTSHNGHKFSFCGGGSCPCQGKTNPFGQRRGAGGEQANFVQHDASLLFMGPPGRYSI